MKPSGLFSALFGKKLQNGQDADSDEVTTERQDMIRGIEELSETTVKEVMVPRIDTVFIPIDADREELLATVTGCGHSRIPVYRETIDDVVGDRKSVV